MNKERRKEVLSYLGNRGKPVGRRLLEEIEEAEAKATNLLRKFRLIKKYLLNKIEAGFRPGETGIVLTGQDVKRYFEFSDEIYVVCVSIGEEVSNAIEKELKNRVGKALVLDAVSSAMVTHYMMETEEEIEKREREKGFFITKRFGAGYGDLPLSVQKDIFETLELEKKGFSIDENNLLTPEKTLISLIGVLEQKEEEREEVCSICRFQEVCRLKKQGAKCVCLNRSEEETSEEGGIYLPAREKKENSYQEMLYSYQKGEILLAEFLLFLEEHREVKEKKGEVLVVSVSEGKDFGKEIIRTVLEAEGFSVLTEGEGSLRTECVIFTANFCSKREEVEEKIAHFRKTFQDRESILVGGMFSPEEIKAFSVRKMRDVTELLFFMKKKE